MVEINYIESEDITDLKQRITYLEGRLSVYEDLFKEMQK